MARIRSLTLVFGLVLLTLGWVRSASAYEFFDSFKSNKNKIVWSIEKKSDASEESAKYDFLGDDIDEINKALRVGNPRLPWSRRYHAHSALVRATCAAVFDDSQAETSLLYKLNYNGEGRGSKTRSAERSHNLVVLIDETGSNIKDSLVTETYQSILFNTITSGVYDKNSYVAVIYPAAEDQVSKPNSKVPANVHYIPARDLCYKLSGGVNGQGFVRTYLDYSAPNVVQMDQINEENPPHLILNYGLEQILLDTFEAERYLAAKKARHRILDRISLLTGSDKRNPVTPNLKHKPADHTLAFAVGTVDLLIVADSFNASRIVKDELKNNVINGVTHYCGVVGGIPVNGNLSNLEDNPFKKYVTRKHSIGGCITPSDVRLYTATLLNILNPEKALIIDYFSPDEYGSEKSSNGVSNTYFKNYFGFYNYVPDRFVPDMQSKDAFTDCTVEKVQSNPYPYCTTMKGHYAARKLGMFSNDLEHTVDLVIMQISENGLNPFKLPKSFKRFIWEFFNSSVLESSSTYSHQFANICITGSGDSSITPLLFKKSDVASDTNYEFNDGLYIWNFGVESAWASSADKDNVGVMLSVVSGLTHESALSPVIVERPRPDNVPKLLDEIDLMGTSISVPYSRANTKLYAYMNRYKTLGVVSRNCAYNPADLLLTDVIMPLPVETESNPLDVMASYYFKGARRANTLTYYPMDIRSSPFLEDIYVSRDEACEEPGDSNQKKDFELLWGSNAYNNFPKSACRKLLETGPYFIDSQMLSSANVFPVSGTPED